VRGRESVYENVRGVERREWGRDVYKVEVCVCVFVCVRERESMCVSVLEELSEESKEEKGIRLSGVWV
jgi:hypothetical protein